MSDFFQISPEDAGKRLDMFLHEKLPMHSRSHIKNMIEKSLVEVDDKVVTKAGFLLKDKMKVSAQPMPCEEISTKGEDIKLDIVFEDEDLLVINKPQGMVVHPCTSTKSGTLVNALLFHVKDLSGINGCLRPGIVHRLDKDTSGLLVVAKNDFAHKSLAEQIKQKTAQREYLALLEGNLKEDCGRVETFIGRDPKDRKKMAVLPSGRVAITEYKVLMRFEKCCLTQFNLKTGRTHQIRVHSKYLGHSIVGDKVYGHEVKGLCGQLLHAHKLSFFHPRTNEFLTFEAPLSEYFSAYLAKQKQIV